MRIAPFFLLATVFVLAGAGPGLDGLSDAPLRVELANDGLPALLDRAFVVDQVPEDQRKPEQAVLALHELADPKLSAGDHAARLRQIVAGIGQALPRMNDPQLLLGAGAMLVREGVVQDVNTLEYFGEDSADATQARLQPIVNTAVDLYARAVKILDARQSALQDKIAAPGDPAALAWQKVYQDYQTAAYTRWMLSYSQVLAMDRADVNRAKVAQEGIDNLQQWDTPDSGVQGAVRLQIAKLYMAKGSHADLLEARQRLEGFFQPQAIIPPPDAYTLFNARYFVAVCDILDGSAPAAEQDGKAAEQWRAIHLPSVSGDEYAMDMLHYRIALLKQDNAGAVKILEDLADKAPGLRSVIAGQILDKLPPHADPTTLSPLMLSALVQRAWSELARTHPDRTVLDEGLAAAREYLVRADHADPQTTAVASVDASKIRGVILKEEGNPTEAAAAFIDHAQRYKDDPNAQASQAIDQAIGQIAALYHGNDNGPHQSDIAALEDRLFPLAVNTFGRTDLAYDYARRLQRSGQFTKAAAMFDRVGADDPNAFNAQFFKMVALQQRLQAEPADAVNAVSERELPEVIRQLQDLARRVIANAHASQTIRVRTMLLAADVALNRGRDPKSALEFLRNFESASKGMPDAQSLLGQALNLRVAADMQAHQTTAATAALLEYLNTVGGNEGLQTVYNLLTQLNQELDQAQSGGNPRRVKEIADDRAALTPFLVKWAQSNPNPDISRYTYRYRVFDAATQKQSAELETDPARRAAKLADAMARYRELQTPENVKLYQASLPADASPDAREYPDPAVILGMGEVAFAMGDWKSAHDAIGQLLADSRLGDGTIVVKNAAGQDEVVDNEQFWEAQYQFIDATWQLSRDPASGVNSDTPRIILGRLTAIWQDRVGGTKWHGKFEKLSHLLAAAPASQASESGK